MEAMEDMEAMEAFVLRLLSWLWLDIELLEMLILRNYDILCRLECSIRLAL